LFGSNNHDATAILYRPNQTSQAIGDILNRMTPVPIRPAAAIFATAIAAGLFNSTVWPNSATAQAMPCALARQSGTPQIPGLTIVYLFPLGDPAAANRWENIIIHQMEGPAGAAKHGALAQAKDPTRRGVTLWVETDGIVYWAVPETAIPTHGDGANRNDNKHLANLTTYRRVVKENSLGIEFAGNFPDARKPATPEQNAALLKLLPFLQERYAIPSEKIYAHNWIDFKDHRYCEGCELAEAARRLNYKPACEAGRR
jgi:hypothetical protein